LTTPGEVLWALSGHLGTVRDIVWHDATSGRTAVAARGVYDAIGQLVSTSQIDQDISAGLDQVAADEPFVFTGRALANTGVGDADGSIASGA